MPFHVLIIITLFLLQQGEGANVTVPEGHWRISLDEETILRCPYGANSCLGGTSAGDFLCSDGFSGLLCAVPEQNHYIEWSAQDSFFCDDATTLGSFVIPVLVLVSLLVFICRNVGLREGARQKRDSSAFCKIFSRSASRQTSTSSVPSSSPNPLVSAPLPASVRMVNPHRPHDCTATPTSLQSARPVSSPTLSIVATSVIAENETADNGMGEGDDHAADANFDLLHKIRILIFALQISCSLPSVLHLSFGPYLSSLLQYFSYLSVASLQMLPWPCYASSALFTGAGDLRAMSYVELMQTASVLPLAALAVVCVLYALHMECVHLAYKSDHCYWELVDSFYRLFFVAMLPALFPYANPMQLLVGIAVTMLFIKIQMHYKPFVNPANERLMKCALVQVLLLLVCAMGSELDLPDIHYGSLHLYDGFMCLVALLTPLLFLYQTLFTTYCPPISTAPATATTTATTNLAITSPSVRTHRPHPAVLHNNARNSFSECDTASEGERCTPRQSRRNSSRRYASSRSSSQRYSQKHVSTNSRRSNSSPRSPRSPRSSKNTMRESTGHKLRHSNSTAEYSHPSSHSNQQEEHKEDGVRFSVNQQGLLLSTPPRRSRNSNTTASPHNATHNTPPHNKNRTSSEARAIPTMFTFDRDLAVYTHETVTYDQLSAEKAAREKNTHNISHVDHLSQSFMYQSEGEHSSGVENNGLNTPLYQSESENLTESEEEEEKQGDWSTDSDNECASPKYALNMATTSYNSVNLSNKQRLYVSNSNRRQHSAHSPDYHTVRNTAMNRVSVHKAPSPVSTPPHSDLDCDSAGSFGRADKVDEVRNMRSTYSPTSSISGSVKGNNVVAKAKSDRPIWHSMFSDPSDGEEELPMRRIPSIFTSSPTESTSKTNANTVTAKTTTAVSSTVH